MCFDRSNAKTKQGFLGVLRGGGAEGDEGEEKVDEVRGGENVRMKDEEGEEEEERRRTIRKGGRSQDKGSNKLGPVLSI